MVCELPSVSLHCGCANQLTTETPICCHSRQSQSDFAHPTGMLPSPPRRTVSNLVLTEKRTRGIHELGGRAKLERSSIRELKQKRPGSGPAPLSPDHDEIPLAQTAHPSHGHKPRSLIHSATKPTGWGVAQFMDHSPASRRLNQSPNNSVPAMSQSFRSNSLRLYCVDISGAAPVRIYMLCQGDCQMCRADCR